MVDTYWEAVAALLAGLAAGTINAVVGSGSLITFPVLLWCGLPPITANVSNNIGLLPGSVSAVYGYRRELAEQRRRSFVLGSGSVIGSTAGALLLLQLPGTAFNAIAPALVGSGIVLVLLGPAIQRRLSSRVDDSGPRRDARWLWPMVALLGTYGGYFGAAQGVLLLAMLGIGTDDTMQNQNAVKNSCTTLVNAAAAAIFLVAAPNIDWLAVGLIAGGSVIGGQIGSTVGRRLPPAVFRSVVVTVGAVALMTLL